MSAVRTTFRTCAVDGCERGGNLRRGLCKRHYNAAYARGEHTAFPALKAEYDGWVNPLVCVCEAPDCDRLGMCHRCYRKPLELLRRPS